MRYPLAAAVLLMGGLVLGACGEDDVYPGMADARRGDPAEVRVESPGRDETSPRELTVAAGTEVTFKNRTTRTVFVRFDDPIDEVCADPHRFGRTRDGHTYASEFLAPFGDARLCIDRPGRYRFLVTLTGIGPGGDEPAQRGVLVVVPR